MAHDRTAHGDRRQPLVLIVPDAPAAGRPRWQEAWVRQRSDTRVLELGDWDDPRRNTWVNKLNLAIYRAARPIVLVAQGLGCLAVAWWAEYERPKFGNPVTSGVLVSPPDLDRPGRDARLARFGACPRAPLPFDSFLVAGEGSRASAARLLAKDWGCRFADAEEAGRTEGNRDGGNWAFGQSLVRRLLDEHRGARRVSAQDVGLGANMRARGLVTAGA